MTQPPFSQKISSWVRTAFSSRAAATVNALKVEPGSKASREARLRVASTAASEEGFGLEKGNFATAKSAAVLGAKADALPATACDSSTGRLSALTSTN